MLSIYAYNLIRTKRLLIKTALIFVIQYFAILYTDFTNPTLPFYAPIGIAFVMFYLLGNNAFWGLLLGSFCAYFIKGFSIPSFILYSLADIGCGFIGAFLSQRILSSDVKPFENRKECLKFIVVNAFITCLLSSSLRIMSAQFNIYQYINLWLADLNAILIFSGFFLTWLCVPFSREKISGSLIGTAILFLAANIYQIYFIVFKTQSMFVPLGLFVFTFAVIASSAFFAERGNPAV